MSNSKTIKLKNIQVSNPQYSPGVAVFSLVVACIIEILIMLGIV